MTIPVTCPQCQKSLRVSENLLGKKGRCPQCAQVFVIQEHVPYQGDNEPPPEFEEDPGLEATEENAREPISPEEDFLSALEGAVEAETKRPPRKGAGSSGDSLFPVPKSISDDEFPEIPKPKKIFVSNKNSEWEAPVRRKTKLPKSQKIRDANLLTTSNNDWILWLFLVALVPLVIHTLGAEDDAAERLSKTIEINGGVRNVELKEGFDGLFDGFPDNKIIGAHLSRFSSFHWFYALISCLFFGGIILTLSGKSRSIIAAVLAGLLTGTIGILLLLVFQFLAEWTQGYWYSGRLAIFFYILKFIGFSYGAAQDPENGFLLSLIGYTFGVGLCEELCKVIPVYYHLKRSDVTWKSTFLIGLASGVGFGISEGIMYSGSMYNGISGFFIYLVRFLSCVSLHALWSGCVGILMFRGRRDLDGESDGFDVILAWGYPITGAVVLHGLYDTLLKKEMNILALVVALISFGITYYLFAQAKAEEEAWAGALEPS